MADAGLDAELELSIARALEAVGVVERALDQATQLDVEATAEGITTAIDSAVDAADAHTEVTADAGSVTSSIDAAVDAADTHVEVEADTGGVVSNLRAAAGEIRGAFGDIGRGVGQAFGGIGRAGVDAARTVAGSFASAGRQIASAVSDSVIGQGFRRITSAARTAASAVGNAFSTAGRAVSDAVTGAIGRAVDAVRGPAAQIASAFTSAAGTIRSGLTSAFTTAADAARRVGSAAVDIGRTYRDAFLSVGQAALDAGRTITSAFTGQVARIGSEFLGLGREVAAVGTAGVEAATRIGAAMRTSVSESVVGTAFRGISSAASSAASSVAASFTSAGRTVSGVVSTIGAGAAGAARSIGSAFSGAAASVGGAFGSAAGRVSAAFGSIAQAGQAAAAGVVNSLQGVSRALGGLANTASSAFSSIGNGLRSVKSETDDAGQGFTIFGQSIQRIAALAGGVLAGSIISVGVAYNSLIQRSRAAFEVMLGTSEQAGQLLGQIEDFARTSPFPRQEFIAATQTLLSFGFAGEQVLPTLSAIQDAVAATGQTSEQIGEISLILAQVNSTGKITAETLNQLGFRGINAAQLIAAEMGTTEEAIRSRITAGTLDAQDALDALVAGMTERFGGAADLVKQTWDGAVDRIKGAIRDIGAALTAPFVDPAGAGIAVDFANDIADALRGVEAVITSQFAPAMGRVAEALVPALGNALQAASGTISSVLTILTALAPALEVVAHAIALIPPEAITMVTLFLALRAASESIGGAFDLVGRAIGVLSSLFTSAGGAAGGFGSALRNMSGAAIASNIALAGAAVIFAGYAAAQQRARQAAAELAAQQTSLRDALRGTGDEAGSTNDAFQTLINDGLLISAGNFGNLELSSEAVAGRLTELGVTVDDLSTASVGGQEGIEALTDRIRENEGATESEIGVVRGLIGYVEEAAQAAINAGAATGDWSARQAEAAISAATARDGTISYTAALENLQGQAAAAAEREREQAAAAEEAAAALEAKEAVMASLGSTLTAVQDGTGNLALDFSRMAVAANEAELSEDQMAAAADLLGVSVSDLESNIEAVSTTVSDFTSNVASSMPSIAGAINDLGDEVTFEGLRESFRTAFEDIVNFQENLATLAEFPAVQAAAAQAGPEVAAVLAQGFRDGGADALSEMELLALGTAQTQSELLSQSNVWGTDFAATLLGAGALGTEGFLTGLNLTGGVGPEVEGVTGAIAGAQPTIIESLLGLGQAGTQGFATGFAPDPGPSIRSIEGTVETARPTIIESLLGLGTAGTEGFGQGFRPNERALPSIRSIEGTVETQKPTIIESLLGLGTSATTGFGAGFQPVSKISPGIGQARAAVSAQRPTIIESLLGLGQAGTGGFGSGLAGMPREATSATSSARGQVDASRVSFLRAAKATGEQAVAGLRGGMGDMSSAARAQALRAVKAVSEQTGAASSAGYSVGAAIGAGMRRGIIQSSAGVAQEAYTMVARATKAARQAAGVSSPSRVFMELGEQMVDGLAIGLGEAARAEAAARASAKAVATAFELNATPAIAFPGSGSAGGGRTIVVQAVPGMVQISLPAGADLTQAEAVGRRAASAFVDTLAASDVRVAARMASG